MTTQGRSLSRVWLIALRGEPVAVLGDRTEGSGDGINGQRKCIAVVMWGKEEPPLGVC